MSEITTTVYADADLPETLRTLLKAWEQVCFTPNEYTWSRVQWRVVVWDDGVPVSHAGIVARRCALDGRPLHLAGLSTVMTPPDRRRRGYASAAVARAGEFMREVVRAPFGLLVTGPDRAPLYARHGWQRVDDPLLVAMPDGSKRQMTAVVMILALAGRPWPGGTIDLCGLPW